MGSLTGEDMQWLDGKFEGVKKYVDSKHKETNIEINHVKGKQDETEKNLNALANQLNVHLAQPCEDVIEHEAEYHNTRQMNRSATAVAAHVNEYHNPQKFWKLVGTIIGAILGVGALGAGVYKVCVWFFNVGGGE